MRLPTFRLRSMMIGLVILAFVLTVFVQAMARLRREAVVTSSGWPNSTTVPPVRRRARRRSSIWSPDRPTRLQRRTNLGHATRS